MSTVLSVLTEEDTWFGEDNCPDRVSTVPSILTNKDNCPDSLSTSVTVLTSDDTWLGKDKCPDR